MTWICGSGLLRAQNMAGGRGLGSLAGILWTYGDPPSVAAGTSFSPVTSVAGGIQGTMKRATGPPALLP